VTAICVDFDDFSFKHIKRILPPGDRSPGKPMTVAHQHENQTGQLTDENQDWTRNDFANRNDFNSPHLYGQR